MPTPFEEKRYFGLALDPIHVGVGGHRLERVDLPVLRDPGTGIPKIPGTSLAGIARSYTALVSDKGACAGKGGERGDGHCGQVNPACPVCVPFGFSRGSGSSLQGLASIFDAHVLLFPVASMAGPVWVTSRQALADAGVPTDGLGDPGRGFSALGPSLADRQRLNLGWLLLQAAPSAEFEWNDGVSHLPQAIRDRAVLLSEGLFARVVTANLETRTSVSIDPETGAAEEGALFTLEAVPRATVFRFEAVFQDGRTFRIGREPLRIEGDGNVSPSWVRSQVEKGFALFESLGVGGMTTRGMGRFQVLNLGDSA